MTERFTFTYEKIGKYWRMGIVDHQTKEPFDEAIYEVNPTSFQDSKDEMEDLCLLMNEMAKENEQLRKDQQRLYNDNIRVKQLITEAYRNERTRIGQSVLKQLIEQI